MFNPKFYKMEHRGSLDDSLKTRVEISLKEFNDLLFKYNYTYYCYDDRIHCHRFIISKMEHSSCPYTWIMIDYFVVKVC